MQVDAATQLHARGVRALNRGRLVTARRLLEQARLLDADPDLRARVDGSLAYVLFETGHREQSLLLCREALEEVGIQAPTRGVLYCQIGLVQMLRGEGERALTAFGQAASLVSDPQVVGRVHLNRGNVYLQRSETRLASSDFEIAERAYHRAGDELGAAKSAHNLGYALMLRGDLIGALVTMGRAAPAFEAAGPVMLATSAQDRAEVLLAAGLVVEGQAELERAARAYGRRRLVQRQAEAELALARTLLRTEPRHGRAVARRAYRRFERTGAPAWMLRAEAVGLLAAMAGGRLGAADLVRVDEVAADLAVRRLQSDAVMLRLKAALQLHAAGDLAAAARRSAEVRIGREAGLELRLVARELRAAVADASGSRSRALQHVRSGLDALHTWQSSFGSLDLQTNVVGHGVRLGVQGLELAVQSRAHAVVFEWSERARMLASRVQPVRAPQEQASVADLAELRSGTTAAREAELRRQIRQRAWQQHGSGAVADPVTLTDLQAGLGDGVALAAYVVTAERVVALVVTDRGTRRFELGGRATLDGLLGGLLADLDMAASELPGLMARVVRDGLAARLSALGEFLVAPLLASLGDRRVVLTPSGVLAGVPWTLLPGLAGRPVTQAQSATSWLARSARPLRTATAGFVAGPRVPRAEAEVVTVARQWRGSPTVLTGADARADAVTDLAGRVDVLHVAAHGRHSAENPLFSGLELADGTWFGYDIDQLAAVPDVVLLSACELGRSSVRWGEELIGMTAAWLHAGARCVIASAAAVNDAAAYAALVAVHAGLATGVDPAAALAAAPRPADGAPAPFVCFG